MGIDGNAGGEREPRGESDDHGEPDADSMERYRYVSARETGRGGTIYDAENEDAWITSTVIVPVRDPSDREVAFDPRTGTYLLETDWRDGSQLVDAIADTVGDIAALDRAVRAGLSAKLDAMGIGRLVDRNPRIDESVSVSLVGHLVTVAGDGRVTITPPARE